MENPVDKKSPPMIVTKLKLTDSLPLTCSRTGTCCHGKTVHLNPWELAKIAKSKQLSTQNFVEKYCDWGGIKLKFEGEIGYKNQRACSQYLEGFGCRVHAGRPLACRLYPLGRQIQNEKVEYIHEGKEFPCLEGCPVVSELPSFTVEEYLQDQSTQTYEKGQDNYLEVMQQLADIAFELYLDSGLAESGNKETLNQWMILGDSSPDELFSFLPQDWRKELMHPEIITLNNPTEFATHHLQLLLNKAQSDFGSIASLEELQQASVVMMAVALQVARSIGADPKSLAEHWAETARAHL